MGTDHGVAKSHTWLKQLSMQAPTIVLCICIYHIFFICSSPDGHLGCFHILAVINKAVINIRMRIFFALVFSLFLEKPRSRVVGFYGSSIFNFLRKLCIVFHSGHTNLQGTPTMHKGSPFSTFLPTLLIYLLLFDKSHSDRWEGASPHGFDLHFSGG